MELRACANADSTLEAVSRHASPRSGRSVRSREMCDDSRLYILGSRFSLSEQRRVRGEKRRMTTLDSVNVVTKEAMHTSHDIFVELKMIP